MAAKYTWSVDTTKLLISEYKCHENLYNPKHPDYKNRNKGQELYQNIADCIKVVKPGCTVQDIKKKINGLRSQYLTEKMKVLNSMKSGADGDDVYTPSVYWYPMLKFLEASTTGDESVNNIDNEEEPTVNFQDCHSDNDGTNDGNNLQYRPASASSVSSSVASDSSKKQKLNPDLLLLQASKTMAEMSQLAKDKGSKQLCANHDTFDTFGKFVANELRSIDNECHNPLLLRQAKRKIQQVMIDTWDTVESASMLSSSSTTLDSFSNSPTIIVHNASGLSNDVIADAIKLSNLNDMAIDVQTD